MIYEREILKGRVCPEEYKENLLHLLVKINNVRDAFGYPMIVNSGYRTLLDHMRIYKEQFLKGKYVPKNSNHLYCQAVDISDPDKKLQKWCIENEKLLAEIGLWMEDFIHTPNWVHFQIVPPTSGKRFFKVKT